MRRFFVLSVILSFLFCGSIFGAEGDVIWTRTHNGTDDGHDYGRGIAVDGSGNVYVTGSEDVIGESDNIWVRKYDSNGIEVWTSTHNGVANDYDYGYGIAVDGSGNVYVTGSEDVTGESDNIWVRKYDSNGIEVWTSTYNGAANSWDEGYGIAVDGSGNVYVTGNEYVTGQSYNIWVRKYDSGGNKVWTRTYNDADDGSDRGYGIAVDGSGNVYVTGLERVSGEDDNIWVRKYDTDGNIIWTETHNGAANTWDEGYGIAVDGSGNVYVTGYEIVPVEGANIWVRKYDTDGNIIWTSTYNGAADTTDRGYGIAVDGSGNVYVIGSEWDTVEGHNIWVRKYDSNGIEVWTRSYNGLADDDDVGYGIAVDGSGNVYVTGSEYVAGEEYNIWVRKYEGPPSPVLEVSTLSFGFGEVVKPASKTMIFTISNSGGGTLSGTITTDRAWIRIKPTSFDSNDVTVFVTVYTDTLEVWRTYTGTVTIDSNGGVETIDVSVLPTCVKTYPNPYSLSSGKPLTFWGTGVSQATIKIYTLSGELVKTLKETEGEDKITWDGRNEDGERIVRGIYFFTTKNPRERNTGKFTVVR